MTPEKNVKSGYGIWFGFSLSLQFNTHFFKKSYMSRYRRKNISVTKTQSIKKDAQSKERLSPSKNTGEDRVPNCSCFLKKVEKSFYARSRLYFMKTGRNFCSRFVTALCVLNPSFSAICSCVKPSMARRTIFTSVGSSSLKKSCTKRLSSTLS